MFVRRLAQLQLYTRSARARSMASTSIPKTMKGIILDKPGGPEDLQYKSDLPVPVPRAGEVLVKNDFIGVNYVDIYWRTGLLGFPPKILGREAEGTILSTGPGNLHNLKLGDRIVWLAMGGYAEYTAVSASTAYKIPSDVKPGVAAAAAIQGLTALILTHEVYSVQRGDWVLVHAAAGGVGLWMCQVLKALGANTIGTASTAEKIELANENGAGWMINYKEETDLVQRIMEITKGQGVKVVYDSVGREQAENNLEVLAENGILVNYGASSGRAPPPSPATLAAKNIKVIGPGATALMSHLNDRQKFEERCSELFDGITKHGMSVKIHATYPLSEIVRAHRDLEGRKTTGKILMKP